MAQQQGTDFSVHHKRTSDASEGESLSHSGRSPIHELKSAHLPVGSLIKILFNGCLHTVWKTWKTVVPHIKTKNLSRKLAFSRKL